VAQPKSQSDQLQPGTVLLNRFRIEKHVGSGGYASVYRAIDLKTREMRAIKEVTDSDPGVRRQFELEAGLLTHSSHPNIPAGYQIFEERGRLYLVMAFVDGRDLEELLNESLQTRRRPLDEAPVLEWAISVCDALVVMHEREVPIIHRDIKPANIKITPQNRPILIDFGLAKLQTGRATQTAAQGVSPGFAPPEQYMARGKTDARTDIYGLGATLYACLTGKDPPDAPSRLLVQTGGAGPNEREMVPPREFDAKVPVSDLTSRIVVKSLELSPSARYKNAQTLRDDLVRALRQLRGDRTGLSTAVPAVAMIACHHCGEKTRADAPRCPSCGAVPRASGGLAGNGARRPAPRPNSADRSAGPAAAPRQAPAPAAPARQTYAPAARPAPAPPAPRSAPAQPAATVIPAPAASARQTYAPAPQPAPARVRPPAEPERAKPAMVDARTAAQVALPTNGRGMTNGRAAAVVAAPASVGALATPPPTPAIAVDQREAAHTPAKARLQAQPVAIAAARPAARPVAAASQPRSWLNFGGPELTSLGKGALALSVIETCWGALVLALAIVEIAAQNSASKPYVILAGVWFILVIVLCLIGGQLLTRPVHRRGRKTRRRRAFNGFGLVVYSLAVHAGGIWGILVFSESRPNAPLAIVAFMIFAVNVLVAGIASVANTLG
jgi:serine/threonine-protein kinase